MGVRERDIRKICCVVFFLIAVTSCGPEPLIKKEETYAPIEASLSHINQKVAGHFIECGIPEGFDAVQYRAAVEQVCFPNPYLQVSGRGYF
jgi:hypothetical protein